MERTLIAAALLGLVVGWEGAAVQTRPQPRRAPAKPAPPKPTQAVAEATCPTSLGVGLRTKRLFCDVLIGRSPQEGVVVAIPPHRGEATLVFDLHNRHTYSEQETKAGRAYAQYTATINVLTMDGTLLTRAVVQSEFRRPADLLDRVGGGAGPSGLKAVAPVGAEQIVVKVPPEVTQVSLLGEHLIIQRLERQAESFITPGRPIALVSGFRVEYQPAPARRRR